jgi:hypothetical protein
MVRRYGQGRPYGLGVRISNEECVAAIGSSGGYCAINPYWHPDPSSNGH